MDSINLIEVLKSVDPSLLDYQDWVNVGMALHHEGYTAADWDDWSKNDERYHHGECFKKWISFHGTGTPVTAGTVIKLAIDQGYKFPRDDGHELDWGDEIRDELVIIAKDWVEGQEIEEPSDWNPVKEITTYLETLFDSTESVGYVTSTWERDGTYMPTKGNYDRTAGELIEQLGKCNGDMGEVFGDYKREVGAWIRFNPLDGQGVKNENVTDFRYALVESDNMDLDKQNAILRELELPIACMVYSGNKSIHAIVKIEAVDYIEYRKRVDYLYNVCQKNALIVDTQNKNPSRLSRMPGVERNGRKQFLIDTNIGKPSWAEWHDWIEGLNDDLPEPERLTDTWDDLPALAPPLIHGLLRQGHKMLMAGPSKAGKSYALIELCISIAEGKKWMNWQCAKGRILYVNLELDRASCLHRFKDVYTALKLPPTHVSNIDVWNLRGKSVPMDKLAPKLIRRAQKKDYIAIVLDPIYKVITGDENSADQMAHFTNQFDKICTELGTAVIYCHHHSKGYQGGKRSMDRASGSGVFARDPDALLDLTELELTDAIKAQMENKAVARSLAESIKALNSDYYYKEVGIDDLESCSQMYAHVDRALNGQQKNQAEIATEEAKRKNKQATAWRLEGTLREFASFDPVNLWFNYPIHATDRDDLLIDAQPESEKPSWQKAIDRRKDPEVKKEDRRLELETAYEACNMEGDGVTINDLSEYMGVTSRTVWNRLKEYKDYEKIAEEGKKTLIRLV